MSSLYGIIALILTALFVQPAGAQSWFTKDTCWVKAPEIDPGVISANYLIELEAEAAEIENGTGRLWRITGPDGAISHLWGTWHSNDPAILDLPVELRRSLREARFVAPEIDHVFRSREQFEIARRGDAYWVGTSDPEPYLMLDRRVLKFISLRLLSLGYGDGAMSFLTPEGLAMVLLGDPCNDFAQGVYPIQDSRIQLLGQEAGAEVVGLEPPNAILNELGREERLQNTLALIEMYSIYLTPTYAGTGRQTAVALYLQGRIGESMMWDQHNMKAFFGREKGQQVLDRANSLLLHERNRTFVDSARPLLVEGGAVIAVGAYHLPGDQGLISLFRSEGFEVERIPVAGEVSRRP